MFLLHKCSTPKNVNKPRIFLNKENNHFNCKTFPQECSFKYVNKLSNVYFVYALNCQYGSHGQFDQDKR